MFGQYFTPVESKQLNDGFYIATIKSVETQTNSVGEYLIVTVEIDNHKNANPNKVFLNDMPPQAYGSYSLEECQNMWKRNMTKFFQSFGIEYKGVNPFNNVNAWVNHRGEVTVRPQKNGNYKELVLFHQEAKKTESAPAPVQATATVFGGNVQTSSPTPNGEEFPEDIFS